MTGTEEGGQSSAGGRIDRRHLVGVAVLAFAGIALLAVAVPGAVFAQDQPEPGEPISIYGDAVDELGNGAPVGTTIYAVVDGEVQNSINVSEEGQFGGPGPFEGHIPVENGTGEVVFAAGSPEGVTAAETVDLSSADASVEVSLTFSGGSFAQIDPTDDGNNATDTSADGLLNDVDGDGAFTIFDVQALFNVYETQVVQNNAAAFDFDGDGEVSITDVQALFDQLAE